MPLILAVVFVVLVLLLRALVAPLLLVATVVLTYVAALGAGRLVFDQRSGYPALARGSRCWRSCSWSPSAWTTPSS